jgi:hypothetical protein
MQQGGSTVHLLLAGRCIILQQLLLLHGNIKLSLHLIKARLHLGHALLSSILLLCGNLQKAHHIVSKSMLTRSKLKWEGKARLNCGMMVQPACI